MIINKINAIPMKHIYLIIASILPMIVASCSSYTSLMVSGKPGTVIQDGDGKILGTIDQTNEVEVQLDRNSYYAYLLSVSPGSEKPVPFALEYDTNMGKYRRAQAGNVIGVGLAGAGLGLMLPGTILMCVDALLAGGILLGSGAGLGIISALGLGLPCSYSLSCDDVEHCYRYLSYQTTNEDMFAGRMSQNGHSINDFTTRVLNAASSVEPEDTDEFEIVSSTPRNSLIQSFSEEFSEARDAEIDFTLPQSLNFDIARNYVSIIENHSQEIDTRAEVDEILNSLNILRNWFYSYVDAGGEYDRSFSVRLREQETLLESRRENMK